MNSKAIRLSLCLFLAAVPAFVAGCSGGSSESNISSGTQNGSVNMIVSDASTEDWATIGVKILSISLIPQGGGTNVSVYSAAQSSAPTINLVQLDQLGEILGNISVPAGTYTGAVVTVSGNPADVQLTAAADPSSAFLGLGTAGATVPSSQVQVQGTTGSAGSMTVPVTVNFVSPLVVTANQTSALDLEFDLSHPAFIVGHAPTGGALPVWAVNFTGPIRHHPIPDITRLVLRHTYGTVTAVASDGSSLTIAKDFPVEPPTNPETAVQSSRSLQILPDATNGTLYYDVDAKAGSVTIKSFSTLTASLPGKYVRIAARYQSNGSLVAVRVWASSTFNSLWVSPEGHVLHVNTATNVITIENELGKPVPVTVNASTQFFYRTPWNAVTDSTPIGTGTGFLAAKNLVRGFKVHATVVDPLASPLVAQTVDIEIARYDGVISAAGPNSFTYTRNFNTPSDNYTFTLPYISSSTPNGTDPLTGAPITGFKWWNFTFPTIVDSGTNAVGDFEKATNGGIAATVTFGPAAAPVSASGENFAVWGDPASTTGWAAPWAVLDPTALQLGTAVTGYVNGSPNGSFTMKVPLGTLAVKVNMSTVAGSGTLVYQVDRTGAVVTVTPVDITTQAGQTTVTNNLLATTPVEIFGVPQPDGTIKAYVVFYFTGVKPTAID